MASPLPPTFPDISPPPSCGLGQHSQPPTTAKPGRAQLSTCGGEQPPAGPVLRTPGGSRGCTLAGVVAQ
jgi:hypothetical protein